MTGLRVQAVQRLMGQRNIMFKFDLAQQAGVSYPLLRQYMEEGEPIDAESLERLCRFFGCQALDILAGEQS